MVSSFWLGLFFVTFDALNGPGVVVKGFAVLAEQE